MVPGTDNGEVGGFLLSLPLVGNQSHKNDSVLDSEQQYHSRRNKGLVRASQSDVKRGPGVRPSRKTKLLRSSVISVPNINVRIGAHG
jgi:hypothetical protein